MKTLLIAILGLTILAAAPKAWTAQGEARGHEGNGGFAVLCAGKYILVDHYEAVNRYGYTLDLGGPSLSVDQKIELVLSRLERLDPERAKKYREWVAAFDSEKRILQNQKIVMNTNVLIGNSVMPVLDIGNALLPDNCPLIPLAQQVEDADSWGFRYAIYGKYWKSVLNDNDLVAGLKLHEVIYRDMIAAGKKTSEDARFVNALISSKEIQKMTTTEYAKKMLSKGLRAAFFNHTLAGETYLGQGNMTSAWGESIDVLTFNGTGFIHADICGNQVSHVERMNNIFHKNGTPYYLKLAEIHGVKDFDYSCYVSEGSKLLLKEYGELYFSSNGQLRSILGATAFGITTPVVRPAAGAEIVDVQIFQNKQIKSIERSRNAYSSSYSYEKPAVEILIGQNWVEATMVRFDEAGQIVEAERFCKDKNVNSRVSVLGQSLDYVKYKAATKDYTFCSGQNAKVTIENNTYIGEIGGVGFYPNGQMRCLVMGNKIDAKGNESKRDLSVKTSIGTYKLNTDQKFTFDLSGKVTSATPAENLEACLRN